MNRRTDQAEIILTEYCRLKGEPLECLETEIIDLMTDLMHLARKENLDALSLTRMAQMHFLVEEETNPSPERQSTFEQS